MIGWLTAALLLAGAVTAAELGNLSAEVVALGAKDPVLKLNVSWLPASWTPSSYSVIVTSVQPNSTAPDDSSSGCAGGSIFYTSQDAERPYVLLPENRFGYDDAPELDIQPGCSYMVQAIANPSSAGFRNAPSVVVTVPECVAGRCSCVGAARALPVPLVGVRSLPNGSYAISWRAEGPSPTAKSYRISVGEPHLTSSSGLVVYNKTEIFTTSANNSFYMWNPISCKKGTKIFVTAEDENGCFGKEGSFEIRRPRMFSLHRKYIFIIITIAIISTCLVISGVYSFVKYLGCYRNYKPILLQNPPRPINSVFQNPKIEALLKHHNILYAQQEIVDDRPKDPGDEYEIAYERLRVVRELGRGQFGRVYLADLLSGKGEEEEEAGAPVAVKMSLTGLDSPREQLELHQELLDEIAITKLAGAHPHLVGLVGCCTGTAGPVCLVLEYMSGGDLLGYLHRARDRFEAANDAGSCLESPGSAGTMSTSLDNQSPSTPTSRVFFANDIRADMFAEGPISHAEAMRFALEIAKGMEHLEAKGIVHRDLAARNILMDQHLTLKISDFGLSRRGVYTLGASGPGVRRLPLRWMPPEAVRRQAFTSRSDVWSYGLVLWEIASLGELPYPGLEDADLMRFLLEEGGRPEAPAGCAGEIRQAMEMCWARRPEARPNFRQILGWLESSRDRVSKNNPAYQGLLLADEEQT